MIKKILISMLLAVFAISVFASSSESEKKDKIGDTYFTYNYEDVSVWIAHNGYYSIPCYKCKLTTLVTRKGYSYCLGCPTWRCYGEKNVELDGEKYMVYRCQHGHKLLVSLNSPKLK